MKITADANILFSALIKEGLTRKIWFNPEIELISPKFLLVEFKKYAHYLKKKSGLNETEFGLLSEKLLSQIRFIEDQELKPYLPAAASLSTDPKDWLYIACALKEDTIIWSQDKELKNQQRIKTLSTQEMQKEIGLL